MQKSIKYRLIEGFFKWFGRMPTRSRLRSGAVLAALLPLFSRRRKRIVQRNLQICFPKATEEKRQLWAKQHTRLLAQSIVDRGFLWYGDEQRIRDHCHVTGVESVLAEIEAGHSCVILAPHFISLDAAATRLSMYVKTGCTLYKPQHDAVFDDIIRRGRTRFNQVHLVSSQEGFRKLREYILEGIPVYYLPDMDFGRRRSIFVPFFGVQSATLPSTAQMAETFNIKIFPLISRLDINTGDYYIEVLPALENFPGDESLEEATARLNRDLEQWILQDIPQYYWVHRRFKTRPEGEPSLY